MLISYVQYLDSLFSQRNLFGYVEFTNVYIPPPPPPATTLFLILFFSLCSWTVTFVP